MRTYKTEGIILKRRNIGEADRLVTVFTKFHGKITVKAAGVRKITSRRASHIELLNYSLLTLYKGKNTIPILTEVQTITSFPDIKNNLSKVGFSYHICELIDALCAENQEQRAVFTLFLETLHKLSGNDNFVSTLSRFEITLLESLGFYPPQMSSSNNTSFFIEQILEKKLKTLPLLPHFL